MQNRGALRFFFPRIDFFSSLCFFGDKYQHGQMIQFIMEIKVIIGRGRGLASGVGEGRKYVGC